jgi:hypothetical protein|tara:strand:+ start:6751 stop:6900 length:150 start_codon:yes stop_codon:yes gene_type:complete
MGNKKNKKDKSFEQWEKLGFAGLILSALNNAGKSENKVKKKEVIKKEYW